MTNATINPEEVAKFSALADQWWDLNGPFKPLHQLNPLRIQYIQTQIINHMRQHQPTHPIHQADPNAPLSGLRVLDIGCGGGLISEPLAQLGAEVTAIDASDKNIAIARYHAEKTGLIQPIDYQVNSAESLAESGFKADIVLALEIVEHVANLELFLKSCAQLIRPGGMLIIATLNRTWQSWLLGIVAAEYVLRWLPKGTHDWKQFVRPEEIVEPLRTHGLSAHHLQGIHFNPLSWQWHYSENTSVNYLITLYTDHR
jgi:2-polyprenyl-6-hydroxyphenyl methylase/3-demethylubiquinone-9 3-methyltransferase